jgi:hypothetical protein
MNVENAEKDWYASDANRIALRRNLIVIEGHVFNGRVAHVSVFQIELELVEGAM